MTQLMRLPDRSGLGSVARPLNPRRRRAAHAYLDLKAQNYISDMFKA
jgi:hypothetical protein